MAARPDWTGRHATPFRMDAIRGVRYVDPIDAVEEGLRSWFETSQVEGGILMFGQAWWLNGLCIKFSGPGRGLKDSLRPSYARRAAEASFRILPVPSPKPLYACELRRGRRLLNSVLVYEFVVGKHLHEIWDIDPKAPETLPAFLADMHLRGIYHADFHMRNFLWTGERWVLLDLDALRMGIQALFPDRLRVRVWSTILRTARFDERVRGLFDEYVALMGPKLDADSLWSRAERDAQDTERQDQARRTKLSPSPK